MQSVVPHSPVYFALQLTALSFLLATVGPAASHSAIGQTADKAANKSDTARTRYGSSSADALPFGTSSTIADESKPAGLLPLEEEVSNLLRSKAPKRQESAMRIIVTLGERKPERYDFSVCIEPLKVIYTSASNEEQRLLALWALNAIGSPTVYRLLSNALRGELDMQATAENSGMSFERVRLQTEQVLKNSSVTVTAQGE
jgi:hypothetical protein